MKTQKFNFYEDPGHGWLKVPRKLLVELGIEKQITMWSYQRSDWVFLEEDQDCTTFELAMLRSNVDPQRTAHYANKRSRIRGYEIYKPRSPM